MMETIRVDIMESVYAKNAADSDALNRALTERGVFCVNILGSPGAGKTGVIARLINSLPGAVIEGDIESDVDAKLFDGMGIKTIQINTGGACHLDAVFIKDAARRLDFRDGFLYIENIGNLVCPAEFEIGEHIKLLVSSVTEGADKPYKYPLAFEKANIILLNKIDLLPYLDFEEEYFTAGIRKINTSAPIFRVSAKSGEGFDAVIEWLTNYR